VVEDFDKNTIKSRILCSSYLGRQVPRSMNPSWWMAFSPQAEAAAKPCPIFAFRN